jgi:Fuc2NAc and GlcNAc transferase
VAELATPHGMMTGVLMVLAGAAAAALAVGAVRRYALARSILDLPNERSSHHLPTPSGGGLGLIIPFLALVGGFLAVGGALTMAFVLALFAIATLAVIGWIDDRAGVSVPVRLAVHVAAALTILPLAMAPAAAAGAADGKVVTAATVIAAGAWVFAGVSAINVVNFMDGIDGLIGSQLLLFGVHLALLATPGTAAFGWGLLLAATCAGFLVWNWPPARIFMGDAGSGALGLAAVVGGALLVRGHGIPPLIAFLPLYALFLDAATTLVRRILRRERIWEAHRSHLYQRLANSGWGHRRVTLLFAAASSLGILVAALWPDPPGRFLVLAYLLAGLGVGAALNRAAPPHAPASSRARLRGSREHGHRGGRPPARPRRPG